MPTTFNTTDPKPGYVYDAAVDTWFPLLGIAPASQVDRWTKTAAGGETSLSGNDDNAVSLAYTSGTEQVYLNGVLLVRGQDYTATNGTTITGLTALTASDVAEVVTFNPSNIITTDAVLSTDFTAKGDIISASAASTPIRLAVGANGTVLKANSATTSGLEWGTVDADIEGVTAGTGISGGGTSGTVTITNSMATAIDAKGDLVAGTGADAFARLAVGTNGQVLTAASGEATGLSWATPSSGGMTLISTTTLTGASVTLSSIPQIYNNLHLVISRALNATSDGVLVVNPNNASENTHNGLCNGTAYSVNSGDLRLVHLSEPHTRTDINHNFQITFFNYTSTTERKPFIFSGNFYNNGANKGSMGGGTYREDTAITSINIKNTGGNLSSGTVLLYGVK